MFPFLCINLTFDCFFEKKKKYEIYNQEKKGGMKGAKSQKVVRLQFFQVPILLMKFLRKILQILLN